MALAVEHSRVEHSVGLGIESVLRLTEELATTKVELATAKAELATTKAELVAARAPPPRRAMLAWMGDSDGDD